MEIRKWIIFILFIVIILFLLFLSTKNGLDNILFLLPEDIEFIVENKEHVLIISYVMQTFILITVLIFEVILLFFLTRLGLGKQFQLKEYVIPVLITSMLGLALNFVYNELFLTNTSSMDDYKNYVLSTPINYLIKPILICYLLFHFKILSSKVLDWIIVGGGYLLFTYVPGFLLLSFL
ncbi:hypothetical protein CAI16_15660 [Virgibacillus dokdonensis]|uniref:Yip1 domain protein n=1 Tax=Virgibacillus dokdonensis TaxID=302167 RepID=A0A3E0WJH9_9BACI|nr:hypothetical protein [Virgibacillus dokdonensis]RFA33132.1 hypothetical protein CAI16_15660 [Virgibacillus dokdonensis]